MFFDYDHDSCSQSSRACGLYFGQMISHCKAVKLNHNLPVVIVMVTSQGFESRVLYVNQF